MYLMYINYRKKFGEVMYYVVDQSNPKEPMEYICVTRKDDDEIHKYDLFMDDNEIRIPSYYLNSKFYNEHSLFFFRGYSYETKPEKVGTLYTYLLNIFENSHYDGYYSINLYNDIDFILFYSELKRNHYKYPLCELVYLKVTSFLEHPSTLKNGVFIGKFIAEPPLKNEDSQINLYSKNYAIQTFYNEFFNIKTSPLFIFKMFMIQALNTLIHFISSSEYNSPLQSKEFDDLLTKSFFELTDCAEDYGTPYSDIRWEYFDNEILEFYDSYDFYYDQSDQCDESLFLYTLLGYLKKLRVKYQSILFIPDDFDYFDTCGLIYFILDIYVIIHSYNLLNIEVVKYHDNSTMFNYFDNISNNLSDETFSNDFYSEYKIKISDNPSIWFWDNTIQHLCEFLLNSCYHQNRLNLDKNKTFDDFITEIDKTSYYCDNFIPLEYLVIKKVFISLLIKVKEIFNDTRFATYVKEFDILSIINNVIKYYQDIELSSYTEEYYYESLNDDSNLTESEYELSKFINEYFSHTAPLLYYKLSKPDIIDLFMPAIKAYLMFSKHPLARCARCGSIFLKTSPNRKFCDSTLTLQSGKTCKEEREAITDHKSEYQKTTNDFNQYLQKVSLKGGPSYTRRVYSILRKNKYFNPKKPENFDNKDPENFDYLSKTDRKDLLWVLNSFFNYSYAIMESMNFQEIVKDPKFKDIRYYNNSPENTFTPDAYKKLFEEYKTYTRTNKGNGVTEVFNIYDSLVKFSEKDSELSFKTIRSKSMQDLNGNDIEKLFEITETVIRVFFLKLSEWYLEDPKQDYPSFFYAFPKEFATTELSNIEYINKNANDNDNENENENIENLKNKIKKKGNDPYLAQDIKNNIQINEDRKKQVIDLITKLEENIKKNHPFK